MKKSLIPLTLVVAGLLATPALVSAQDAAPEGGRRGQRATPEEQVKAMKETLKLTDEQVEKVKAVLAKNQEKIKALREDTALSQEDRRAKMRELSQGMDEELKPILTPEQQTKWKEEREKRRAQRANQ
jgi:protein CpxP